MAVKICKTCGIQFEGAVKSKYCSQRCKGKQYWKDKSMSSPGAIRKRAEASIKGIIEDEAKARELGLSYGVYKAMQSKGVINGN